MCNVWHYDFPIGGIGIAETNGALSHVFFDNESGPSDFALAETPLIRRAAAQLAEYFDGKRTAFDVPLSPRGTDFQLSVWNALQRIPFGETRSYKEIAEFVGNPKASRAVGMANNRNPIAVLIPCHRVIGANGGLVGYGGGLPAKRFLLNLEGFKGV